MEPSEYYMNLANDPSGSRTKNRFRIELLWGVSKLIDAHKEKKDYTVVFDFRCDIELHYADSFEFYQVKTKNRGNHTYNSLTQRRGNSNSILGKLYALYSPNQKIKLAVVCNKNLKIGKDEDLRPEICFGELDKKTTEEIKTKLKKELALDEIDLDNVFYICDGLDLIHPEDAILGKLVKSFEEIKKEEPKNPNALYRLVCETVQKKATYELNIKKYDDVLKLKGISRDEFDEMLNSHSRKSITGIKDTQNYIKKMPIYKQRRYNRALSEILDIDQSHNLNVLKTRTFRYLENNIEKFEEISDIIEKLKHNFDNNFPIEFTEDMKYVFYLRVVFIY